MSERVRGRLRVLLVDDYEDDAVLLSRQLARHGYEVVTLRVETRTEMRAALDRNVFDLVMCEYRLRWFDIAGALEELRSSGSEIPLVVASGSIDPRAAVESLEAGAREFIAKDDPARLGEAVDVVLGRARGALLRPMEQSGIRRISSSPPPT